jgi:hypothetical protein
MITVSRWIVDGKRRWFIVDYSQELMTVNEDDVLLMVYQNWCIVDD